MDEPVELIRWARLGGGGMSFAQPRVGGGRKGGGVRPLSGLVSRSNRTRVDGAPAPVTASPRGRARLGQPRHGGAPTSTEPVRGEARGEAR